jgi:hypothetical protein
VGEAVIGMAAGLLPQLRGSNGRQQPRLRVRDIDAERRRAAGRAGRGGCDRLRRRDLLRDRAAGDQPEQEKDPKGDQSQPFRRK